MSNNEPLVSVIIPLYNAEKYILETIASVINQTYKNWELIVADDCSTDNSTAIVEEFEMRDSRIRLIKSKTNFGGPARPRNIGIENSKGVYIAFLDADDVWSPEKLQKQISIMQDTNLNFTSTTVDYIDANTNNINNKYKSWMYLEKLRKKRNLSDLIKKNFIFTSSVLVDKGLISSFDENKELIAVEDFCQWLDILNNSQVKYKYLNQPLLQYRILEDSISNRKVTHRHDTKANICVLNFILSNNRFDLLKYYNIRIIWTFMMNSLKALRKIPSYFTLRHQHSIK